MSTGTLKVTLAALGAAALFARAPAALGQGAAPRRTDVAVALGAAVPAPLVPLKPGTTEKAPARLEAVFAAGPLPPVTALCFTPDGAGLLVGSEGRVSLWDLAAGRVTRRLEGVEGKVHDMAFSPDGKVLAVAGGVPARSGTVLLYDGTAPSRPTRTLAGHTDTVYGVAWNAAGTRVATAGMDRLVQVHDLGGGKPALQIREHTDAVHAVAFSPDGMHVVSAGKDKTVKMCDAATGKSVRSFSGHNDEVLAVAVSPDGKAVLSAGVEPALRWWDAGKGSSIRTQNGHGRAVYEIRFSRDGRTVITVSEDQTVRLWDGASGAQQKAFNGGEPLFAAALSPDGKRAAAGSGSGLLRLWDTASGRLLVLGFEAPERAPQPEFLLAAPEGYLAGSENLLGRLRWRVGGQPVEAAPFTAALAKPDEVSKALRGEAVAPVKIEAPAG